MSKNRRANVSNKRKRNRKRHNKQYILTLIVSLIIISSVLLIVYDSIKRWNREQFHSFYDNKFGHKYAVRGVDVSHHNGNINWSSIKNEGITFAFIKSTEGISHKDRNYRENYKLAKDSEVNVGTYHFYTFGLDGVSQAQHFIRHSIIESKDLVPAIDVEHSQVNRYSNDKDYIQNVISELIKLENELYNYYGVRPLIYTNKDCYKLYIESYFPENLIWMSDLHNEPNTKSNDWIIWQFSHTGNIAGINGDIDLNFYRYSFRKFNELLMP